MIIGQIEFTVWDSGPIDGVKVTERNFEFVLLKSQRRWKLHRALTREQLHIYAVDQRFIDHWNECLEMDAIRLFYQDLRAMELDK